MTKWKHDTVASWRARVKSEAKLLALRISTGAVDGPDIVSCIEQLVVKAAERRPDEGAQQ